MAKAGDTALGCGVLIGLLIVAALWAEHWIAGLVGLVLMILILGWLSPPTKCQVCGNPLRKTSYKWELEDKRVTVCPKCNTALERKRSREAIKRYL